VGPSQEQRPEDLWLEGCEWSAAWPIAQLASSLAPLADLADLADLAALAGAAHVCNRRLERITTFRPLHISPL